MATLEQIPSRDTVEDGSGIVSRPWLRWLNLLRDAVNRLIGGTFDGDVTVAGDLTVTGGLSAEDITADSITATTGAIGALAAVTAVISGALSAGSAAITGTITAAAATLSGAVSAASATISGAISAATLTLSGLLTLTGGQIRFPATQAPSTNANTLDDYEEGTWTPTDVSGAGLALAAASGTYIKVGRLVMARAVVQYPATANGSGAMLGGLPFTVENAQCHGLALTFTTRATAFTVYARENATRVELLNFGGTAVTNANMSGAFVGFAGTYISTQ